jgi:hypothetical protein
MNRNILLINICVVYSVIILYVFIKKTSDDCSISSVVCKHKKVLLSLGLIMGIITVLYERGRKDLVSLLTICYLLVGIYGLLLVEEKFSLHFFFAGVAFLSILCFMINFIINFMINFMINGVKVVNDMMFLLLFSLVVFQVFLIGCILKKLEKRILSFQTLYLLNFAIFYLLIH